MHKMTPLDHFAILVFLVALRLFLKTLIHG